MNYEIVYNKECNCLKSRFVGNLTLDSVKEYAIEIAKMAKVYDCKRFINDLREANIQLSFAEFFNAPPHASIGTFNRSWKRAVVVKHKTGKLEFFETTATNQGFNIKIFEDMDEALKWL